MNRIITRLILPLLIVGAGAVAARGLLSLKASAARRPPASIATQVDVVTVTSADSVAMVTGTGMVKPALEITLIPEVSGRVTSVSPSLVPGGRFKKGQVIAKIDARDYELIIRQQQSQVRRAELDLKLEAGRQKIAKREWELLGDNGESAPELALRKPHFAAAKWSLDAAQSGLERAQLALERTVLRAPFNAVVMSESLDVGQVVGPGTRAAHLIGTDRFRVEVSVPVERIPMLAIPELNATVGSVATVVQRLGDDTQVERTGRVLRLLGELDHQTRTAQLLLAVDDPLEASEGGPPLLPGAYVKVSIDGRPTPGMFSVPRSSVHDGHRVWTVDSQSNLQRRDVRIRWTTNGTAFVTGDLADGDRVVTTPLSLPIVGMAVQVNEPATPGTAARGEP